MQMIEVILMNILMNMMMIQQLLLTIMWKPAKTENLKKIFMILRMTIQQQIL